MMSWRLSSRLWLRGIANSYPVIILGASLLVSSCDRLSPKEPAGQLSVSTNEQVVGRGEGKDNWWNVLPRTAWKFFELLPQSQPWFEVYEVEPGIFAIYEPGQFEEIISYLVLGSERALLFDTGIGVGDIARVVSELTSLPIVVLNSHTHYDHVGGNHQFEMIYGTHTEYTRKNSAGRRNSEVAQFVGEGWVWKPFPVGFDPASYVSRPFSIDKIVDDGELVDLGGRILEVLLTPGHAPDSLCLLDRENRLLLTGDTFYPASLYSHLEGSDFDLYESSAARLAELAPAVDSLLPGHNEPIVPAEILERFHRAFGEVREPGRKFVLTDGQREYAFDRFSLIVSEPPPWLEGEKVGIYRD